MRTITLPANAYLFWEVKNSQLVGVAPSDCANIQKVAVMYTYQGRPMSWINWQTFVSFCSVGELLVQIQTSLPHFRYKDLNLR